VYYAARVPDLQAGSGQWRGPCPIHNGEDPNFAVNPKTGNWFCHSQCGRGGSVIELEVELAGSDFKTAQRAVLRVIGREWRAVADYEYTDEAGEPLYRVVRRERGTGAEREKTFHQEHYQRGRWIKGLGKTRRVPYRLHKVVNARRVFVVEGEKDCDTIRKKFKLCATTNPMGAGNWPPEFGEHFKSKRVVILPDNDAKGNNTP